MLSWRSGRTKSPFMSPTRKQHSYTRGQILQQLNKMRRQAVLDISPARPRQLTAAGTDGGLPGEVGAPFVSSNNGWSEDPGEEGGSRRVGMSRERQYNLAEQESCPSVPHVNDCCFWTSKDKESMQNVQRYVHNVQASSQPWHWARSVLSSPSKAPTSVVQLRLL